MTILCDNREPHGAGGLLHPWASFWPTGVRVVRGTLETGDVALAALPDGAVVERKTVSDFLGAVGRERKRFDLELKRARYCGSFLIIVEGTLGDVLTANHARGQLSEAAILGTIASWSRRGAPVLFAGGQRMAAEIAFRFLSGQVREIERAAKAVAKAEAITPWTKLSAAKPQNRTAPTR